LGSDEMKGYKKFNKKFYGKQSAHRTGQHLKDNKKITSFRVVKRIHTYYEKYRMFPKKSISYELYVKRK